MSEVSGEWTPLSFLLPQAWTKPQGGPPWSSRVLGPALPMTLLRPYSLSRPSFPLLKQWEVNLVRVRLFPALTL